MAISTFHLGGWNRVPPRRTFLLTSGGSQAIRRESNRQKSKCLLTDLQPSWNPSEMIAAIKKWPAKRRRDTHTHNTNVHQAELAIFTFAHRGGPCVSLSSYFFYIFSFPGSLSLSFYSTSRWLDADGVFQFPTYSYGRSEKETWRLLNR